MDPNILEFYASGESDMHSFVCKKIAESGDLFPKEIVDLSLKEIKNNYPNERQISKSAGFAINYGGVGFTIANNLGIPKETGEKVYEAYFKAFPGLATYFKQQKAIPLKTGFIQFNDVSYRKYFVPYFDEFLSMAEESEMFGINNRNYFMKKGDIERNALNYPIQGTSSDITKLAAIYLYRYIIDNGYLFKVLIPNMVHDEIHIECEEELSEKMAQVLKKCMEDAGDKFCKTIKLKADPHIGDFWTH